MKTILLILFSILPATSLAQELKPAALQPVKVSIVTDDTNAPDVVRRFHRAFKRELSATRIAVISKRKDAINIYLNAQPLTAKGVPRGFIAVVAIISPSNPREHYWFSLQTGADIELIAREFVSEISRDVLHLRGEYATKND